MAMPTVWRKNACIIFTICQLVCMLLGGFGCCGMRGAQNSFIIDMFPTISSIYNTQLMGMHPVEKNASLHLPTLLSQNGMEMFITWRGLAVVGAMVWKFPN